MNMIEVQVSKGSIHPQSRVTQFHPVINQSERSSKISERRSILKSRVQKSVLLFNDLELLEPRVEVTYRNENVTPIRLSRENHKAGRKLNLELEVAPTTGSTSKSSVRLTRISSQIQRFCGGASETKIPKTAVKRMTVNISLDNIRVDNRLHCDEGNAEEEDLEEASAGNLPKMSSELIFPEKIKILLEETETVDLFGMPSITVPKGSEEGDSVEKDNEEYDYLTVGLGRNRKTVSTEAQTSACILKTRHTVAPRTRNANSSAFASVWDMFDSYKAAEKKLSLVDSTEAFDFDYDNTKKPTEILAKEERDIRKILNGPALLDATMMMERILANNNFKTEQEDFKGLISHDVEENEDCYNYELQLLWKYCYFKLANKPVTTMCVNTCNSDIIAVGYGKFRYSEVSDGIVCIWSIKNPTQPERYYKFDVPLTSMAFSKSEPNLLALGFYNGDVHILDITPYEKNIIACSSRNSSPSFLPIWHLRWFYAENYHHGEEQIISIGQDGRINSYFRTKTLDFVCDSMMRLVRTEGSSKSAFEEVWCIPNEIPIQRNNTCHFYCPHPAITHIYFIGTSDGYIYKCSTNYLNQHISFFLAHDGPVYGMQFSPFCKAIFVTCGADWMVKLWREDVLSPLITLTTGMSPVMGIALSPTHSTIIVAVSGTKVYMWNIRQKIDTPSVVTDLSMELHKILFTKDGKNFIISDRIGCVHMYTFIGVCKAKEYQDQLLEETIHNALQIKPDLLHQLKKAKKAIKE